jgi:hypothetical protein
MFRSLALFQSATESLTHSRGQGQVADQMQQPSHHRFQSNDKIMQFSYFPIQQSSTIPFESKDMVLRRVLDESTNHDDSNMDVDYYLISRNLSPIIGVSNCAGNILHSSTPATYHLVSTSSSTCISRQNSVSTHLNLKALSVTPVERSNPASGPISRQQSRAATPTAQTQPIYVSTSKEFVSLYQFSGPSADLSGSSRYIPDIPDIPEESPSDHSSQHMVGDSEEVAVEQQSPIQVSAATGEEAGAETADEATFNEILSSFLPTANTKNSELSTSGNHNDRSKL